MVKLTVSTIVAGMSAAFVLAVPGLLVRAQAPHAVGTWAPAGFAASDHSGGASVPVEDGRTLIAGSVDAGGAPTDVVWIIDPRTNLATTAGHLLAARLGHAAALLADGRVLVVGGTIGGAATGDLEIFDPASGNSVAAGALGTPRSSPVAARLAGGTVLIVGGWDADGNALRSAEVFDPATGSTAAVPSSMLRARAGASATTLLDGRVLIAGGNDGNTDLSSAEIYDPGSQTFDLAATSMSVVRSGHSAVLLPHNGSVLIAGGGSNGTAQSGADLFLPAEFPDPFTYGEGSFAATGGMADPRAYAVSGPGPSEGNAFVTGGGSRAVERYRFATIRTDKDDYAPGERAVITGTGWQPGEQVRLLFQEDPAVHDDYVLHVTADENGSILWDQWAPEEHDSNVRFYLMASDSASRAQTTFTDSNPQVPIVTGQNPNPVTAGNSATFTVTIPAGGAADPCTVGLTASIVTPPSWPSPPAGGFFSFSPPSVTVRGGSTPVSPTSTLTVTAPPGMAPNTYRFRVAASLTPRPGEDCQGPTTRTSAPADFVVAAANTPPTTSADNPSVSVDEGDTATNSGTYGDTNSGDHVTISASFGSVTKTGTNAGTWSWAYATNDGPDDSATVTITAADGHGGTATTTFPLTVHNVAPSVAGGPDATVNEGSVFSRSGSFTDPGADTWTATVDYGDGSGVQPLTVNQTAKTFSLAHTYADDGVYVVTVTVTDDDGASGSDTVRVSVENVAPTVNAGADAAISEGSAFAQTGTISDPGTSDTFTATVNFGDGSGVQPLPVNQTAKTFSLTHTYADDGVYVVTVTVTDDEGAIGTDHVSVTVNNVAPVVDAGAATGTVNEAAAFTRAGSFVDPGTDTWTATVDYGDGSGVQPLPLNGDKTFNLSHAYADNGSFTVTVRVTDDDGGAGSDTVQITVLNVAPTVNAGADASLSEGGTFLRSGSFSDPGADTWTGVVNYGDGSGVQPLALNGDKTFNLSHTYVDNGSFTVTVTVTDDDGGVGSDMVQITVVNVAPTVTAGADAALSEGGTFIQSGSFSDPGADAWTGMVNYGDGSASQPLVLNADKTFTLAHTYTDDGVFTVVVTVTDDDGGQGIDTVLLTVANVAPVLTSLTPSAFTVPIGSTVVLTGKYSDAGTSDTHVCIVNWDDGTADEAVAGVASSTPGQGECSPSRTFLLQGVYTITVFVRDDDGGTSATSSVMVTVFDPSAGFVTGGGWIVSPAGACQLTAECVTTTGKANFGFVSKYKKGSVTPEGQTEFQFHAGNLRFHSSAYDYGSLVVSGHKAQYRGTGAINGEPGYRFVLTAYDGQLPGGQGIDRFRIKIIRQSDDVTVYDNRLGLSDDIDTASPMAITGGSIVIHNK